MINVDIGIEPLEIHVLVEKTRAGRATFLLLQALDIFLLECIQ